MLTETLRSSICLLSKCICTCLRSSVLGLPVTIHKTVNMFDESIIERVDARPVLYGDTGRYLYSGSIHKASSASSWKANLSKQCCNCYSKDLTPWL